MPLDRLVLVVVAALAGLAAVGALAGLLTGLILAGWVVWPALAAFAFTAYVVLRIVAERLGSADDPYDNVDN